MKMIDKSTGYIIPKASIRMKYVEVIESSGEVIRMVIPWLLYRSVFEKHYKSSVVSDIVQQFGYTEVTQASLIDEFRIN